MGFIIDLIATVKEMPTDEDHAIVQKFTNKIILCRREHRKKNIAYLKPFQIKSRSALAHVKLKERYEIVILESHYVYSILNNPSLHSKNVILRLHNDETVYFRELAKTVSFGLQKLYYLAESLKFRLYHHKILQNINHLLFISMDELSKFRQNHPSKNCEFLPPPVDLDHMNHRPLATSKVLFVGSLFMDNNKEALKWYIQHVHPKLLDLEEYELIVAGNSRGEDLSWLRKIADSRITIHDSPDDLNLLYDESSLFINPMRYGAGVKLKIINAIQNGMPVVTTSTGNQGTGLLHGEHVLISDDSENFASQVRRLLYDQELKNNLVKSAQVYLRKKFDHKRILEHYLSNLLL
jgi:hypothetical protein